MTEIFPFSLFSSTANGLSAMQTQNAMQRENMARAQDYWKEQFKMINEYNDPSKVVERYRRAGISPSAAFGGSTVGQSSTGAAAPTAPSVSYPPTMQNGAQMFSTIAQALSSLGSAYKNTAEGHSIMTLLTDQLHGLQIDNDTKALALACDKANLDKRQKAEIGKLLAEAGELRSRENVNNIDELLKIEERFKVMAERINEITKGKILTQEANNWQTAFQNEINLKKSQIYFNYKHAGSVEQQGKFFGAQATREEFFNQLNADPQARASLLEEIRQRGEKAVLEKKISRAELKKVRALASQAAFADDMKEFEYLWNKALDVSKEGRELLHTIAPFGVGSVVK